MNLLRACLLASLFLAWSLSAGAEPVDLTSKDGRTIKAEVLEIGETEAKVKMGDREFSIAFDKLKEDTVAKLKALAAERAPKGTVESMSDPNLPFVADATTVFAKFSLTGARAIGEKADLLVKGGTISYSGGQGAVFYEIDCTVDTEVTLPMAAPTAGSVIAFRSNWLMASREAGGQDETRTIGWIDADDLFHREALELKQPLQAGESSAKATVKGRLLVLGPVGATAFHVRCLSGLKTVAVTDAPRPAETPRDQIEKTLGKLVTALQERMPAAELLQTYLLPEDFAKLVDDGKVEKLAEDYHEKDGMKLLETLQSLDIEKAEITDAKAEFPMEKGKPFVMEKVGDTWYFKD